MFRATVAGGVLFLLPIIFIVFLLSKGLQFAQRLLQPLIAAAGIESLGGVAVTTIIAGAALLLMAYLAGLLARTRMGQATFSHLEHSLLAVLPQWRVARGFVESFESDKASEVEVVLVPTDAGWCLGLAFEKPDADWWSVFVPGSPQWTSGSLVYAQSHQVHHTGMTVAQAIVMLRRCGAGSGNIRALLASLQQRDAL
jgi:uncharacterized membrane protein